MAPFSFLILLVFFSFYSCQNSVLLVYLQRTSFWVRICLFAFISLLCALKCILSSLLLSLGLFCVFLTLVGPYAYNFSISFSKVGIYGSRIFLRAFFFFRVFLYLSTYRTAQCNESIMEPHMEFYMKWVKLILMTCFI